MTIYTYESSSYEELAGSTYITINAVNNKTKEPEELIIKYRNYCFIRNNITEKIKKIYNKETISGYKMYQDNSPCSKVYFETKKEMLDILTEFKTRGNLVYLNPDKKLLIEKGIRYKFVVNTDEKPIPHEKIFPIKTNEIDQKRIIYADIEVDSELDINFPTGDNAIHPVISISYVTWNGDLIWTCFDPNIEEDSIHETWKTEIPNNKNLNDLDVEVWIFKNEESILWFVGEIQRTYQSYILTGWNFLRFDMYYLIGRCKYLNLDPSILTLTNWIRYKKTYDSDGKEVVKVWTRKSYAIDSMEAFIRYWPDKLRHNDLDYVAKEMLGKTYSKLEHKKSLSELYRTDKKTLMNYNVLDSLLIKLIDEKINMFRFYELRRSTRGIVISDVFKTIVPIDTKLLYFAENEKVALPDLYITERTEKLKGALTYSDEAQFVEFAGMYDFKSEYASIAASLNCSSNTLVKNEKLYGKLVTAYEVYKKSNYKKKPKILEDYTCSPGIGKLIFFENKVDCFEKKFLLDTFVNREIFFNLKHKYDVDNEDYKLYDIYEQDVKLDGNGLYGAWANKYFRLKDIDCAQAITGIGRKNLDRIRIFLDSINELVVLSDTDSADTKLKAKTPEEAEKIGYVLEKKIADEMNRYSQEQYLFGSKNGYLEGFDPNINTVDTHWVFAKFEKIFAPMIVTGKKKHYAYKQIWQDGKFLKKPKYKVKGFDCVQRNVSPILKEAQEGLIYGLLDKKLKTKEDIVKFIKSYKKKLTLKHIEMFPMTGGYKNEITSYKSVEKGYLPPQHAQAMCNSMANLNIQFEPLSRFKVLKVKRIKRGKYEKNKIMINGIWIKFNETIVGYNELEELPKDYFEYFKPDYDFYYNDLIIKKNEDFLKLKKVDKIVFSNQSQLTSFIK